MKSTPPAGASGPLRRVEEALVLEDREAVGHARDVVSHCTCTPWPPRLGFHALRGLLVLARQQLDVPEHRIEQLPHDATRLRGHAQHPVVAVEALTQVLLQFQVLRAGLVAEPEQRRRLRAHGSTSDGPTAAIDAWDAPIRSFTT